MNHSSLNPKQISLALKFNARAKSFLNQHFQQKKELQRISIADRVRQEQQLEKAQKNTHVRVIPKKKLVSIEQIEVKNKFWMPSNAENSRDQKSS